MRCFSTAVALLGVCIARFVNTQQSEAEITLTRGTTGLGIYLASETRGRGAIVERVVPESAASLVLRAGDVITAVAGVDIRQWSLDNINRLLQIHSRMKIQIRRRAEATPGPQLRNSDQFIEQGDSMSKTASCYASIEGSTDDVHALECTPAAFGEDLPAFSVDGPDLALPVMVAQPLEHCKIDQRFNASGHALLVSRGGCLMHVKARNAARSGAEALFMLDGQFPPFPPLPRAVGERFLPSTALAQPSTRNVNIPVLLIHNETGQRIIQEVRDSRREVLIFSHAGGPPSRLNVKPRNQKPLAIAEKLHPAQHAFDLTNSFRDGAINMAFGTPGLPGGEVPTIHLQVTCELSTILTGLNETVFFTRAALCPVCDGRGAPEVDMRPCKHCSASGEPGVSTLRHDYSQEVQQTLKTTCSHCHGFREMPKKGRTCSRCKGDRVIHERATLQVVIPKGAPDPYTLRFPGIGSQFPGKTIGHVEVVANVKPHERLTRDGADLRTALNISLTEALSGFTRDFKLLNGSTIPLNKTGMTKHGDEIEIVGGGLPHWDPVNAHGGRNSGGSVHGSNLTTATRAIEDVFGSVFVTCTVLFPDKLGGEIFKGIVEINE